MRVTQTGKNALRQEMPSNYGLSKYESSATFFSFRIRINNDC